MSSRHTDTAIRLLQYLLLAVCGLALLLKARESLDWRYEHDFPLYHYQAFLMARYDMLPYRDIYDFGMPGTYAFHYLVVKYLGIGDLPVRCVDLALLGVLLGGVFLFMRRFGVLPAIWSVVLFGLMYLSKGQQMTLQRDYMGIVPIALSLLCLPGRSDVVVRQWRFALPGFLTGLACTIKPQLGIALPIVFFALLACRWQLIRPSLRDFLACALACTAGWAAPVAVAVYWIMHNDLLESFMLPFRYISMHATVTGSHQVLSPEDHFFYSVRGTLNAGGYGTFIVAGLFACYHVAATLPAQSRSPARKTQWISFLTLLALALAYLAYPSISRKFWDYHYMPFVLFSCMLLALLFLRANLGDAPMAALKKLARLLAVVVALALQLPVYGFVSQLAYEWRTGPEGHAPRFGAVDSMANWLKAHLQPGDTVQPLDFAGGAAHALLLAEARLATPFLYDYVFYHHVSSDMTQMLREDFMVRVQAAAPRFFVEVLINKPWISGLDTTREFPALQQLLHERYHVVVEHPVYRIYERNDPAGQASASPH